MLGWSILEYMRRPSSHSAHVVDASSLAYQAASVDHLPSCSRAYNVGAEATLATLANGSIIKPMEQTRHPQGSSVCSHDCASVARTLDLGPEN